MRDIAQYMAAAGRSNALDIEEKQADAVPWYHHMLYQRLEDAKWFWITPDWEVQIVDIADVSLRKIVAVDVLDLFSSSSAEHHARRTSQIPKAERKNLAAPDFAFLGPYMQHCHDLGGALQTTDFEKDEAVVLKQAMLIKDMIDARKSEGSGKNKIKSNFAAAEAGES